MVVGSQFVFFFCIFVLSLWVSIVVAPMKLVCCSIAINAGIVLGCFSTDRAKAKHSIYHLIYIQTVTSGHGEKKKLWLQVAGESSICWLSSALQMELWRELSRVTAAFSWRGRAVFDILGWECTLQKFQASLIFFFFAKTKTIPGICLAGWRICRSFRFSLSQRLLFLCDFILSPWCWDQGCRGTDHLFFLFFLWHLPVRCDFGCMLFCRINLDCLTCFLN